MLQRPLPTVRFNLEQACVGPSQGQAQASPRSSSSTVKGRPLTRSVGVTLHALSIAAALAAFMENLSATTSAALRSGLRFQRGGQY